MRRGFLCLLAALLLAGCACAEALETGARGEAVEAMQERLDELGYLSGGVDGIFGEGTAQAVRLFQQFNGLEATGTLDEESRALLFSEDVEALREPLQQGDEGDAVVQLQLRLIALGFLDDEADGQYGKNTKNAVEDFQTLLNRQGVEDIDITGKASSATQHYLFDAGHSTYLMDLREGDSDPEVLRLERRMLALGYFDGEPDEEYDAYTTQVVAAFEQACDLEATGVAGRTCVETLYSDQAPVAQRHVPHDIFLGDEGQAVREVQVILMETGMLAALPDGVYGSQMEEALDRLYDYLVAIDNPYAPLFATREMLSAQAQEKLAGEDLFAYFQDVDADAQSVEIERLQRRLHTLFYVSAGIIDGEYGQKTEEAVRAFQEKNGLEVTGVADEATQRMLFSAQAVGQWTKYRLDISISDQRVYVYGLNIFGEYELLDTFICSTGLGNTTPKGIFINTQPSARWHYFEKFECWAQYTFQIQGDILFHSVLYDEPDTSTLRYGSVWALGQKASHGCIRLRVEDAKWIYQNCESGTVVVIY